MLACFPYISGWATAAVVAQLKTVILLYVYEIIFVTILVLIFSNAASGCLLEQGILKRNIKSHPEPYKPFSIVMVLSIVQQFSGATVIRGYVFKIFVDILKRKLKT